MFRVDFPFNLSVAAGVSRRLPAVIRKGFYFEHVERRSCFSVTLSDLTAVAEGAEGELAEEKAAVVVVHLVKQTGSERALLSTCGDLRAA